MQGPPHFGHIEEISLRSAPHDWTIRQHRHDHAFQVLLILAGEVQISLGDTWTRMSSPAFVAFPQGISHSADFRPGTQGFVLTLSSDFLRRSRGKDDPLGVLLTTGGQGSMTGDNIVRIDWLARDLLRMAPNGVVTDETFAALAEALLRIVANISYPRLIDHRLAQFRQLIENHITERRDVTYFANAIGTTTRTLSRLCAQHLGVAPSALINRRLAIEAQRLVQHSDDPIGNIAHALGFDDPSYFARFYRRMTGISPRAERQQRETPV